MKWHICLQLLPIIGGLAIVLLGRSLPAPGSAGHLAMHGYLIR